MRTAIAFVLALSAPAAFSEQPREPSMRVELRVTFEEYVAGLGFERAAFEARAAEEIGALLAPGFLEVVTGAGAADYVLRVELRGPAQPRAVPATTLAFELEGELAASRPFEGPWSWPFRSPEENRARAASYAALWEDLVRWRRDLARQARDVFAQKVLAYVPLARHKAFALRARSFGRTEYYCLLPYTYAELRAHRSTRFLVVHETGGAAVAHLLRGSRGIDHPLPDSDFVDCIVAEEYEVREPAAPLRGLRVAPLAAAYTRPRAGGDLAPLSLEEGGGIFVQEHDRVPLVAKRPSEVQ